MSGEAQQRVVAQNPNVSLTALLTCAADCHLNAQVRVV
jgi:hypothetical protein